MGCSVTIADHAAFINLFSDNAEVYDTGIEFFKPLASMLVEHADPRSGQQVLDVGCGRGAVLFPAAERVGPSGSVTGIDLAEGMVAATTEDVRERGLANVTVRRMDGSAPDFPTASFDRILGSMSIILVPELVSALGNYHALLREGGTLAFTAPALGTGPGDWQMGPLDMASLLGQVRPQLSAQQRAELDGALDQFASLQPEALLGDLRTAGFEHPVARAGTVRITADSGKAIVDWTFTHGMRSFWMLLGEEQRERSAHELAAKIDAERGSAESISYDIDVRFYLATK